MLKYNNFRMIESSSRFQRDQVIDGGYVPKESVIGTANIIFDKFAERGNIRTDSDLRFLLGLGNTWGNLIPEQFKVVNTAKKERLAM